MAVVVGVGRADHYRVGGSKAPPGGAAQGEEERGLAAAKPTGGTVA